MTTEIERNAEILEKAIRWGTRRGIVLGVLLGLVVGLGIGYAIAYNTIDRTVVIPLGEATKT